VYAGWDDRLQRPVAVKTIDETKQGSVARSRLWREARSLARVNHPNICQVYDVLEEGEVLVLVMELLDGLSLADRLLAGLLDAAETLKTIRQMLQALQALHDLGIVHRDLKPSNVFLTRHGVKLLDFGLAHTIDAAFGADPNQTATGECVAGGIVGTPLYMSPEQASGLPVGPASDIFSAGSVFYELLTGKRPFEGNSLVDILYAVLHHNPPPLSGSREVEALDRIMVRLLERAHFRRNDAELFAGLVQACRYCDELDASVAAHFRGRHLDPHLITSAAHTYFLMGDYTNTLELYGRSFGYYLDCAALAAMGENQTALLRLREREQSGGATGAVQGVMRSLRAYLEGNTKECQDAIVNAETALLADPEILFYSARQLAQINQTERAIGALSAAMDRGFVCASAITRDSWFASMRSDPHYAALVQEAERRRMQTHAAFLAAGGAQVISIA
jgi:hypothetical protein